MPVITDIEKAANRQLATITPSVSTAYEGVKFNPPDNAMYQRVQYSIQSPEDPTFGTGYHRELVQMQVFIVDVLGKGTAAGLARAELIRDKFKKGTTITEGTIRIHVLSTPQISGSIIASDRLVIPVLVNLTAEVVS